MRNVLTPDFQEGLAGSGQVISLKSVLAITLLVGLTSGVVVTRAVGITSQTWKILVCIDLLLILGLPPLLYGRAKLTALQFALSIWVLISYFAFYYQGGLENPALLFYFMVVFTAGLLIGEGYAYTFAGLSCISALLLIILEEVGTLPAISLLISSQQRLIFQMVALSMAASVLRIGKQVGSIHEARNQLTPKCPIRVTLQLEKIPAHWEDGIAWQPLETGSREQYARSLVSYLSLAMIFPEGLYGISPIDRFSRALFVKNFNQTLVKGPEGLKTNHWFQDGEERFTQLVPGGEVFQEIFQQLETDGSQAGIELWGEPVLVGRKQTRILTLIGDNSEGMPVYKGFPSLATQDWRMDSSDYSLICEQLKGRLAFARGYHLQAGIFILSLVGFLRIRNTLGILDSNWNWIAWFTDGGQLLDRVI